jgi:hypothetical protein
MTSTSRLQSTCHSITVLASVVELFEATIYSISISENADMSGIQADFKQGWMDIWGSKN